MAGPENQDKIVKSALDLIDKGWAQLHSQCSYSNPKKDVIFVLGGTGAGKSAVTQIITGDLTKLHSKQGQHGLGLVIVDEIEEGSSTKESRIGDPRVASKTFLPEYLPCQDDKHLVFVDCPGFDDNRGTHMDIAAMVLIKKIAEQVDHARFLFVVPSSSVSFTDIDRNAFSKLCSHATEFIRNVDLTKDSMSMIITKVSNHDPSTGAPINGEDVINNIGTFLEEVWKLETSRNNQRFIEYLLRDKSKWVLIHYPKERGPLSGQPHYLNVRQQIREICRQKLKRSRVKSNDFAVTLKPESKIVIGTRLVPHMKGEIDRIVEQIVIGMEAEFKVMFAKELEGHETVKVVAVMKYLEEICQKFREKEWIQKKSRLYKQNDKLPVTNKLFVISCWLQLNLGRDKIDELIKIEEQLNLFQKFAEENDSERGSSVQIAHSINNLKTSLDDLYQSTMKIVRDDMVRNVECRIKEQVNKLLTNFEEIYGKGFWTSMENGEEFGRKSLEKLSGDWSKFEIFEKKETKSDDIGKLKLNRLLEKISEDLDTSMKTDHLSNLRELENELEMLLELTEQQSGIIKIESVEIFQKIRKCLNSLLTEARETVRNKYIKLVHAKIQENVNKMIGSLETKFFDEIFYPGLNLETMSYKRDILTTAHQCLKKLSLNRILEGVSEAFKNFEMNLPEIEAKYLQSLEQILDFYDKFLETEVSRPMEMLMKGLRQFQDRLRDMYILYEYLDIAKSTNPNLIELDKATMEGDDYVAILRFLDALRATSEIRRIFEQRALEQDKLLIRSIAKYLASGKTTVNIIDDKMIVKGRNVKFSEFLNEDGEPKVKFVKNILVLGSESVQIDRDMKCRGKGLTITIIADKWIVQGNLRKIQFSGINGAAHLKLKGDDGSGPGQNGLKGLPGNCGGNGGNVFGIYREIENGNKLWVICDGGNGGEGQEGGNGANGMDAKDQVTKVSPFDTVVMGMASTGLPFLPSIFVPRRRPEGGKGGDGGDGGAGGKPGLEGVIKIFSMAGEVHIGKLSCERGKEGRQGNGGSGGRGGLSDMKPVNVNVTVTNGGYPDDGRFPQTLPCGPCGKKGEVGGNSRGIRSPPIQTVTDFDWRDLEVFRKYVLQECESCRVGTRLLQLIDSHQGFQNCQLSETKNMTLESRSCENNFTF